LFIHINFLKENVGKTTLCNCFRSLKKGRSATVVSNLPPLLNSTLSTDGINIDRWPITGKENEDIEISLWDFAGQGYFSFFLCYFTFYL
jgi:GTPase SAR1 family protein